MCEKIKLCGDSFTEAQEAGMRMASGFVLGGGTGAMNMSSPQEHYPND